MQLVTKCIKRSNMVNILVSTENKKVVKSIYSIPQKRLMKRVFIKAATIEEIVKIYFEELNRHYTMGYEVEGKKEGKIILFDFHKQV